MIWKLQVECISGFYLEEECIRTIEIDSRSSLSDLHYFIQDAVEFDRDHLFEFFAGRNPRNRKLVFIDSDRYDWNEIENIYAETFIEHVYPLPKSCKLYYRFHFGDNWYFEIRKSRKKPQEAKKGVPV